MFAEPVIDDAALRSPSEYALLHSSPLPLQLSSPDQSETAISPRCGRKEIDDEGEPIYPFTWNNDFIDLPPVVKRKQRRGKASAEEIERLIADPEKECATRSTFSAPQAG